MGLLLSLVVEFANRQASQHAAQIGEAVQSILWLGNLSVEANYR